MKVLSLLFSPNHPISTVSISTIAILSIKNDIKSVLGMYWYLIKINANNGSDTSIIGYRTFFANSCMLRLMSFFRYKSRVVNVNIKIDARVAYIAAGGNPSFPTTKANGMFINNIILMTIWYVRILPVANIETQSGPESVSMSTPSITNMHIDVVCAG